MRSIEHDLSVGPISLLTTHPQLVELYASAERLLDLSVRDYQLIRDCVEIASGRMGSRYGTDQSSDEEINRIESDLDLHIVLLSLMASMHEGSLCLSLERDTSRDFSRMTPFEKLWIFGRHGRQQEILSKLRRHTWGRLVGHDHPTDYPIVFMRTGNGHHLYARRFLQAEQQLQSTLADLQKSVTSPPVPESSLIHQALREVCKDHPVLINQVPIAYNCDQFMAMLLPFAKRLTVISGGPGTGKTSVVAGLLRLLLRALPIEASHIMLVAPTGRAAQRLSESVQQQILSVQERSHQDDTILELSGSTIHRLLRFEPKTGAFYHHAQNPLSCDLLIVDEVSMVDAELLASLLEALPSHARLVLLGDQDQLPSVEAGAVLAQLIPEANSRFSPAMLGWFEDQLEALPAVREEFRQVSDSYQGESSSRDHLILLTQSYRSADAILKIANHFGRQSSQRTLLASSLGLPALPTLNPQETPPDHLTQLAGAHLLPLPASVAGWSYLTSWWYRACFSTANSSPSYLQLIRDARRLELSPVGIEPGTAAANLLGALFEKLKEARLLTVTREGPGGCVHLNQLLSSCMRRDTAPHTQLRAFPGLPVMMTRNDYHRQLYNGDIGVVLAGRDRIPRLYFPKGDTYHAFPCMELAWEPAFAITVHKSQGSEYTAIMLMLPTHKQHQLMTREIIYTALTRARKTALVCGSAQALELAASRRCMRQSGLPLWPEVNRLQHGQKDALHGEGFLFDL